MNAISLYPLLFERAFSISKQHLSSQNKGVLSISCQGRSAMHGYFSDGRGAEGCVVRPGSEALTEIGIHC